ncbi:hypothetical protein [Macrococcus sp. DPC7161]|uniref:hypothetical protein n=1 Tax=Macrococcus sp. DPC7161 TaxID=2507060 RepID=UPI00100BE012|nr:hypothetical protein [Macrococcus sp. DPC7161]RXK17842.1 hypothetical protein ER639_08620 [Macrococcus sp. DPC7161]
MTSKISKIVLSTGLVFSAVTPIATIQTHAEETQMAKVFVNNEDAESIANVKVSLLLNGKTVATSKTDAQGMAAFSEKLKSKTDYEIQVEGIKMTNANIRIGREVRVSVDSNQLKEQMKKGITFKAYVINDKYEYVKNQKVTIKAISGKRQTLKTVKTNSKGLAQFTKLPEQRSMTVYLNGEKTGYNLRGIEGSQFAYTFYVNKKGKGKYDVKTKGAKVTVIDENDNPLNKQKVEIYRGKTKVRTGYTSKDGHVSFYKYITVGTMYNIKVNGKMIPNKFTKSGANEFVYVASK